MNKLIIALVAFVLLAAGGALAGGAISDSSSGGATTTGSVEGTTTNGSTTVEDRTATVEDVSGPCDEAEHANDPRCAGVAPGTVTRRGDDDRVDDRSGPNRGRDHAEDDDNAEDRDHAEDGDDHGRNRGHDDRSGDDDRGGDDHDNSGSGSSGSDD